MTKNKADTPANFLQLGFDLRSHPHYEIKMFYHWAELNFVLKNAKVVTLNSSWLLTTHLMWLQFFYRSCDKWCFLIVDTLSEFLHHIIHIYHNFQATVVYVKIGFQLLNLHW